MDNPNPYPPDMDYDRVNIPLPPDEATYNIVLREWQKAFDRKMDEVKNNLTTEWQKAFDRKMSEMENNLTAAQTDLKWLSGLFNVK